MRAEIKELHQRLKTTTIYVTHDQIEAMTMADKIVVLRDGRVEQVGAPLDLYDRPANLFVAGFIGSPAMNLLEGESVDGGDRTRRRAAWRFRFPRGSAASGREVVYGIRPEHLEIAPRRHLGASRVVEPTGSETQVFLRFGGHDATRRLPRAHAERPGATLGVPAPMPAHVHLFDAETEKRI